MCYLFSFIENLASSRHFILSLILKKNSMEFSRQKYWSGMPFSSPGDLPNPGIKPGLLHCRWIIYYLTYQGSPHKADIILHNSLLRKLRLKLLQNLPKLSLFLDSGDLEFVTLSDSKAYIFPILLKKKITFTLPELYFSIS